MANGINEYLIGQQIRLSAVFTNISGADYDPTIVALTVKPPGATNTAPTPVKDATGHYHADVTPGAVGEWHYRWTGAGSLVAAGEGKFLIVESQVI